MERWQQTQPAAPVAKKETFKSSTPAKAKQAQQQQQVAKSKKRQGPLPLWLVEFLILGLFGGMVVAAVKFEDSVKSAYAAVDKAIFELSAKLSGKSQ